MSRVTIGPISIEASSSWTLSTVILAGPVWQSPRGGMLRAAQTAKPFQSNIVVTFEEVEPSETLDSYVRRQREGLKAAGVVRRDVASPEKVKLVGGSDGILVEQEVESPTGEVIQQMQLVTIKALPSLNKGLAHTLIASHLQGSPFEEARQEFRKMLLSFS
jgi:hypothetical protein